MWGLIHASLLDLQDISKSQSILPEFQTPFDEHCVICHCLVCRDNDHMLAAGNVKGAVDFTIRDVKPPGTTILYAAPEVLMSLSLRCGGEPDDKSNLMVNGCAADMWSFGCVMYELLTGTKPFLPADIGPSWAHSSMASDSQTTFYDCEAVLEDQAEWVSS